MDSIKSDLLLTIQNNQRLDKEILNLISPLVKSIGSCSSKRITLITTNAGHKIQDQECMISIRWDKSNSTLLARTKCSRVAFQTARTRKREVSLQDREHTRLWFPSRKRLTIISVTILMACSSDKNQRVSSQKRKEVSSGSMKAQHHIPDKLSPRIQDPDNMNTRKRKTTSRTKSSKRRPFTPLSTAAILAQ